MTLDEIPLDLAAIPWWLPGVLTLAFGLLACFYGNRMLKVVLFLLGLTSGGYAVLVYLPAYVELEPNMLMGVAAVAGVVAGVLLVVVFYAGVFLLGSLLGLVVFMPLLEQLEELVAMVLLFVVFLVGGYIALKLQKWMTKLATAVVGAWHAVQSVLFLLKLSPILFPWQRVFDPEEGIVISELARQPWYFWVPFVIVAVAGVSQQFDWKRKRKE